MYESNHKRPPAKLEHPMPVIVFLADVYVHMRVRLVAVLMNVSVYLHSSFSKSQVGRVDSKDDQHQRNWRFHPGQNGFRYRDSKQDYYQPNSE